MANPQTLRVKYLFLPRKGHEVWTEFISLRILATDISHLSQRSLRALREKMPLNLFLTPSPSSTQSTQRVNVFAMI